MRLAELSIKRPVFITCLFSLLMIIGLMSLTKMPVNLFPDITFPIIVIDTSYPGAGPEEVETLVSKVLEDQLTNIPGLKKLNSHNVEGLSRIVAEFNSDVDVKYAEQQVRDKVSNAKASLPNDVKNPMIQRVDPSGFPVLILAIKGRLPEKQIYEIADNEIKPKLEQVNQVGMVEIWGGRQREIHVELDRKKLTAHELSATSVVNRITNAGQNIPLGTIDQGEKEKAFRTVGQFKSIDDIGSIVVSFVGNDIPVTVKDLGRVVDTFADEKSKTYVNGERSLLLAVFQQSGTNTISVVKAVNKKILKINADLKTEKIPIELVTVRDGSKMIRDNVKDVVESILIGIVLTIIVVYLFLGSARSTFITGLALPTSLIGSFFLMHSAGFSINTMSLLALSLAVGLLVDDAIVVRENIFRYNERGKNPIEAAVAGTREVLMAVIAASFTVIAVFGPIGFLHGVVGGFFKEFGLTVCFAMLISLMDSLTMAPMLSAYIGTLRKPQKKGVLESFQRFQNYLEISYEKILHWVLRFPLVVLISALLIFILSLYLTKYIPKTFAPDNDTGEFVVSIESPPGTNLEAIDKISKKVDEKIRSNPEIETAVAVVGSNDQSNRTRFFINMIPSHQRKVNTTELKKRIREQLKEFTSIKPVVRDVDLIGGGQRALNLNIIGTNLEQLKQVSNTVFDHLKKNPGLLDVETNTKPGKAEFQVVPDKKRAETLGVSTYLIGQELRTQVEGSTPAVFRENGEEYDIRVRMLEEQRDLEKNFAEILIPNMNNSLIRLSDVTKPIVAEGPTTITRMNRSRYVQISADIAPDGPGMGGLVNEINDLLTNKIKLPLGMSYNFEGQAENFAELIQSMVIAIGLGILFIYLVLASLYESFIIPLTIMLVLPLAICGAMFALLITRHSLDVFSMIGCVLLMGIATKNSILLVDYTRQLVASGLPQKEALIKAGKTRLRPILMTTIALIAGMLPIAIGLNEASKQRTSMGISVIGGLISSTFLTLVVVPAAYSYIERFRLWTLKLFKRILRHDTSKIIAEDSIPINENQQET